MSSTNGTWACLGNTLSLPFSTGMNPYDQALEDENGDDILSKASMEAVWQRLADRLQTVVADTSMHTLTPEYAAHFHDIYVKK